MTARVPKSASDTVDSPAGGRPALRHVQIFGERCSGTNYLARLIEKNFGPVGLTTSFGGKHWFIKDHEPRGRPNRSTDLECVRRLTDSDDTLFLVIFRDPIDWLRSLHARPYHAPGHWNLPFADFLRKPWLCWEAERVNPLWPERGPYFIEDAENVVRLRSQKIRHLTNLEGTVANVAFVNYEALLDDLDALAEIADRFGIPLSHRPLLDETAHFGSGAGQTFVGPRDYPPVSTQDLRFILRHLDLDLEAGIGYDLPAVPRVDARPEQDPPDAGAGRVRRFRPPGSLAPLDAGGGAPHDGLSSPRLAILVLGCRLPVYDRCIRAIRSTWGAGPPADVDVLYLYGRPIAGGQEGVDLSPVIGRPEPDLEENETVRLGDVILCGTGDVYADQVDGILRKRLLAFAALADGGEYDVVYNVCASSYVDVQELRRYVQGLPATGVYHGPLGVCGYSGYPFVSGASLLLSMDMVADLAAAADEIITTNAGRHADDVAMGRWIAETQCEEPLSDICDRIAAGERATRDQRFVLPNGRGMTNWVEPSPEDRTPQPGVFHYHFHAQRIEELEHFHRRFFAPVAGSGGAGTGSASA